VISLTSQRNGGVLSGISTITWTARDDDLDLLNFTILLLDEEGLVIKTIADELASGTRIWYWNTANEDDGSYRLKLMASDGTDTAQFTTDPFVIRNAVPASTEDSSNYGSIAVWIGLIVLIMIIVAAALILLRSKRDKRNKVSKDAEDGELEDREYRWQENRDKYSGAGGWNDEAVPTGRNERKSNEWTDYPARKEERTSSNDDDIGWEDDWEEDGDWNDDEGWEDDYYQDDYYDDY